jgi:hypothetical protein
MFIAVSTHVDRHVIVGKQATSRNLADGMGTRLRV